MPTLPVKGLIEDVEADTFNLTDKLVGRPGALRVQAMPGSIVDTRCPFCGLAKKGIDTLYRF